MLNLKPFGAAEFDFNGDNRADLVEVVAGQTNVFLSSETGMFRSRALAAPDSQLSWALAGVGDFDGDGANDDLFWRDRVSNKTVIDLVDQGQVQVSIWQSDQSAAYFPEFADFNADGTTDMFWRYIGEDRASEIWFMEAGKIAESLPLPVVAASMVSTIADFNADGRPDLFWQDTATGTFQIWELDGATLLSQRKLELPGNRGDLTLRDFNGDGRTDIFDRERFSGRSRIWFWGEDGPGAPVDLPITDPDGAFEFGDFNGDRRSDILFRSPLGDEMLLFLGQADNTLLKTQLAVGFSDSVVERMGDFNVDQKTDLLVTNLFSGQSQLLLLDGAAVLEVRQSGRELEPELPVVKSIDPVLQPIVPALPELELDLTLDAPIDESIAPLEPVVLMPAFMPTQVIQFDTLLPAL